MMNEVSFVFPHQLFRNNPCLTKARRVFLIEDDLFFSELPFHKQKIMLHHASMQFYKDYLMQKGHKVTYMDHPSYSGMETFFKRVLENEVQVIHVCDPVDYLLKRRLIRFAERYQKDLVWYDSPNFLNTHERNSSLLVGKKKFFLADFYKNQRLHYGILVQNGKPEGGQWSFDSENRKALPKNVQVPAYFGAPSNQYVERAKKYVEQFFPENPGEVETFCYPVTFDDADEQLVKFFGERFYGFGTYQDAFSEQHPFLFHSILSPALNCGLLDPKQLVDAALLAYQEDLAPLNAVEGFIRQVIGWREFVRAVYEEKGVEQRTRNYWGFQESIDRLEQFEPFQNGLKKLEKYAYAHHIERLMLLGNLFTLFRVHPDDVYRFFMTYFIDAYDWVMVPNVYGMTLHADGGLMTTKPYLSGSNYVKKQGLILKTEDAEYWDALFWSFIADHAAFFSANPRMKVLLNSWNGFTEDKKNRYRSIASFAEISK